MSLVSLHMQPDDATSYEQAAQLDEVVGDAAGQCDTLGVVYGTTGSTK